ncbi:hypothetical protein [Carnobacterium maltaromaticum]
MEDTHDIIQDLAQALQACSLTN